MTVCGLLCAVAAAGKFCWWLMVKRRVFWLVGDHASCRALPCVQLAENMRENHAANAFAQVKGMSADICKTVG